MGAFGGWDSADVVVVGDVVAFPVFEEEGCGGYIGVSGDGVGGEGRGSLVDVGEDAVVVCGLEEGFVGSWVVVAEDEEEFGVCGEGLDGGEDVGGDEVVDGYGAVVGGEEVAADEDGVWFVGGDVVVEGGVAGGVAVEVGGEVAVHGGLPRWVVGGWYGLVFLLVWCWCGKELNNGWHVIMFVGALAVNALSRGSAGVGLRGR